MSSKTLVLNVSIVKSDLKHYSVSKIKNLPNIINLLLIQYIFKDVIACVIFSNELCQL